MNLHRAEHCSTLHQEHNVLSLALVFTVNEVSYLILSSSRMLYLPCARNFAVITAIAVDRPFRLTRNTRHSLSSSTNTDNLCVYAMIATWCFNVILSSEE